MLESLAAIPLPIYNQIKARTADIKEVDTKVITSMSLNIRLDRKNCTQMLEHIAVLIIRFYIGRHPHCTDEELSRIYYAHTTINGTQFMLNNLPTMLLIIIQDYVKSL